MTELYANNCSSRLAVDTAGASVTLTVRAGDGNRFPSPSGGDYFMVTIEDRRTRQIEICRCTGRVNDVMVVVRGQEGTVAQQFSAGATVSHRLTAASVQRLLSYGYSKEEADGRFLNLEGGTMEGPIVLPADPEGQMEATTRQYVDNALSARSPAALATAATLAYKIAAPTAEIVLSTNDLYGNHYTLSQANPETVDVYVNGIRKIESKGAFLLGNFSVSALLNKLTFANTLAVNDIVQIDVQTPRNFLAPGQVDVFLLRDIDIAADGVTSGQVDGTRTVFHLAKASDGSACNVIADEEIAFYIDGIQQIPNIDFTAAGSVLTFTTAPTADAGRWGLWFRASA